MRHALVDEALADVAAGGCLRECALRDLAFLLLPFRAVGEQIPRIACAHDARPRQRERHTGGVDGDPAPAPLLGDIGGGAGAAGRVQHQIAGIGGHEDAALNQLFVPSELHKSCSVPQKPMVSCHRFGMPTDPEIIKVEFVVYKALGVEKTVCPSEAPHTQFVGFPPALSEHYLLTG